VLVRSSETRRPCSFVIKFVPSLQHRVLPPLFSSSREVLLLLYPEPRITVDHRIKSANVF
jgi:hypothetical protein